MAHEGGSSSNDNELHYLLLFVFVVGLLYFIFHKNEIGISVALAKMSYPVMMFAQNYIHWLIPDDVLSSMRLFTESYPRYPRTFATSLNLLTLDAYVFRLSLPLFAWMMWRSFKMKTLLRKLGGVLNRGQLLEIVSRFNPSLHAVIGQEISALPYHEGIWRMPEIGIQFAISNGLLYTDKGEMAEPVSHNLWEGSAEEIRKGLPDGRYLYLDMEKADACFAKQLGVKVRSPQQLREQNPIRYLVLAGIIRQVFSIDGDISDPFKRLDFLHKLSKSLKGRPEYSKNKNVTFGFMKEHLPEADKIIREFSRQEDLAILSKTHGYELSFFTGLFFRAKKSGKAVVTDLLWLRPLDRPLFYTLHQVGPPTSYNENKIVPTASSWETASVGAHVQVEVKTGTAQKQPMIHAAAEALLDELKEAKWCKGARVKKEDDYASP